MFSSPTSVSLFYTVYKLVHLYCILLISYETYQLKAAVMDVHGPFGDVVIC